jgi:hypothetical protein
MNLPDLMLSQVKYPLTPRVKLPLKLMHYKGNCKELISYYKDSSKNTTRGRSQNA